MSHAAGLRRQQQQQQQQVLLLLPLVLLSNCRSAVALEICSYSGVTPLKITGEGVLEAHIEQQQAAGHAQTCEMQVTSWSPVSRIIVTGVRFSLDDCSKPQQPSCSSLTDNYLNINEHYVCTCRSKDEQWEATLGMSTLKVAFRRANPASASFAVDYKVQSCNLTALKEYGGYDSVKAIMYDKAEAVCNNSSGLTPNVTSALCNLENGTWEAVPRCDSDGEDPSVTSDAVLQHWLFHSDDDEDGHFPKELVGGLAVVLVIMVVVVIGATIYTIKRRYKVIVIRRPSRGGSRGGSAAPGSDRAAASGQDDDAEGCRTAEERLLPPPAQRPAAAAYGPAPSRQYLPTTDHEYATPFDPAVGTWSQPSGQVTAALSLSVPQPPGPDDDHSGSSDHPQYFVLENVQPAS